MEERKLVWNPFKKEYWRKDNLLPPEKRKQIKEDLRSMRTVWKDSRETADRILGRDKDEEQDGQVEQTEQVSEPPNTVNPPSVSTPKKKRIFWRILFTFGLPFVLTILFGLFGLIVGAFIFIFGLIGLIRK